MSQAGDGVARWPIGDGFKFSNTSFSNIPQIFQNFHNFNFQKLNLNFNKNEQISKKIPIQKPKLKIPSLIYPNTSTFYLNLQFFKN